MGTSVATYKPLTDLSDLRERLDRAFATFTEGVEARRLAVDVLEEPEQFVIKADVPGMKPEEVKVEVKDDTLTVSGSHEESTEEKRDNFIRRERRSGSFARSMSLPRGIDPEAIEATMSDGVLEVRVPKPSGAEQNGKLIEVKSKSD